MAGFASDIYLRPAGIKTPAGGIGMLLQSGGMTFGAHAIPIHCRSCPVQGISMVDFLIRIEMEPALSALCLCAAIPGNRQCLQATIGEGDQVLLQRIMTEGVGDWKFSLFSIGTISAYILSIIAAEKFSDDAISIKSDGIEITEHTDIIGLRH